MLATALFVMGLEIDMKIVWGVLRKPIGPTIGFISQFVFMPLCAYGLAKALLLNGKRNVNIMIKPATATNKIYIEITCSYLFHFPYMNNHRS